MIFLLNAVVCASMAVGAECYTVDPRAGVTFPTREECEDIVYIYNNEQFQRTAEPLDESGQPAKTWTYYCRLVNGKG